MFANHVVVSLQGERRAARRGLKILETRRISDARIIRVVDSDRFGDYRLRIGLRAKQFRLAITASEAAKINAMVI